MTQVALIIISLFIANILWKLFIKGSGRCFYKYNIKNFKTHTLVLKRFRQFHFINLQKVYRKNSVSLSLKYIIKNIVNYILKTIFQEQKVSV